MFADMHMHSIYSDGTNTPRELVEMAKLNGVSIIAISDHDTVDGIKEAQEAAGINGVKVIPAVEISTSVGGVRIHILGYNIDCGNQNLQKYLNAMSGTRTQNTRNMLEKLNILRLLDYSWSDVVRNIPNKSWLSSLDVFEAMRLDGYFQQRTEWKDFYYKYFGKNSPAYLDLEGFTPKSAIEIILEAGGVPVIAHPKLIGDDSQLDRLVRAGLQGIEVHYPAHNAKEVLKYIEYAKRNNLLITGGTDWHGDFTAWNVQLGDFGIGEELVYELNRG